MAFKRNPQTFTSSTTTVVIGTGDTAITLGGENVLPLYSFDAAIENKPVVGIEICDTGYDKNYPGICEFYAGCETMADIAKKAESAPGASFVAISLKSADPNGDDLSVEKCVEIVTEVAGAISKPLVVCGCSNPDKDAKIFDKVAAVLEGKNALILAATEDNYKNVAASAGLAYAQKIGAESAVDINLAKQLNVLIGQMGIKSEGVVMNVGSAAAGYGYEYVASTMDRVKAAALQQNDAVLQNPMISTISADTYAVKESMASEEDMPAWGSQEKRAINMEVATATACLASGSNALILRHPVSVATMDKLIKELV